MLVRVQYMESWGEGEGWMCRRRMELGVGRGVYL